tara:strand:- start:9158 stop:9622 length:465 start_codon:yes stop_codon:yes gene_type:complete
MAYNIKIQLLNIIKIILFILIISLFLPNNSFSNENFFNKAKKLYESKKFDESKFLFQRDIVFNPKKADSYLFLAKIFKLEKNLKEEEKNLNTTLLLDPKNEEAIFLLMDIEVERSNFAEVKELKDKFKKVCKNLCKKISSIEEKLKNFDTKNES